MALANLATMTTLGNPVGAPALIPMAGVGPDGTPQIPAGTVSTESTTRKIMGPQTKAARAKLQAGIEDELKAKGELKDAAVNIEGIQAQGAEAEADVAQDKSDALDKLEEQRSAWRAKREAELATELAEFKRVQNIKTMYQDATPLRKFVHAIALGAGAYASKMNGGPNDAFEIYKEQEDNFRRAQEANLKRQVEKMQASGKAADEILKYFDQGHKQIEMTFAARNDLALKQMAAVKATVPTAAAKADEAMAKLRQRGAELDRNFVTNYDEEMRSSEQTSSGKKDGDAAANRKTESEQKYAMLGSSMKAELNAINKGPALTNKDLEGLQDNTLGSAAADKKAESSPLGAFLVGIGRWADLIPRNRYDDLSQAKKNVVNAWDNAVEKYARILTGAGMPAEEARRLSLQNSPVANDGPETQRFKFNRLAREADFMMSLSNDAKATIIKRLKEGETFEDIMPAQEEPQPQPTGKIGSQARSRVSPVVKKPSSSPRSDYDFIVQRVDELDPVRLKAFDEAVELLGSGDPKKREKAVRGLRLIRDELPKD